VAFEVVPPALGESVRRPWRPTQRRAAGRASPSLADSGRASMGTPKRVPFHGSKAREHLAQSAGTVRTVDWPNWVAGTVTGPRPLPGERGHVFLSAARRGSDRGAGTMLDLPRPCPSGGPYVGHVGNSGLGDRSWIVTGSSRRPSSARVSASRTSDVGQSARPQAVGPFLGQPGVVCHPAAGLRVPWGTRQTSPPPVASASAGVHLVVVLPGGPTCSGGPGSGPAGRPWSGVCCSSLGRV